MYRGQNGRALWGLESEIIRFVFPGVPANSSYCVRASYFRRKVDYQFESCDDLWICSAWCTALRARFGKKSALHPEKLFLWLWHRYVGWVYSKLWHHHKSAVFEPCRQVETASRSQAVAEVCACVNQAVDWRTGEGQSRIHENSGKR